MLSAIGTPEIDQTAKIYPQVEVQELIIQEGLFLSGLNRNTSNTPKIQTLLASISREYDFGEEFIETIRCESGFRHEGVFGDDGRAYGILQFHKPTFEQFCEGDYYNIDDQLECGVKMFSDGLQHHWTCWRLLGYHK